MNSVYNSKLCRYKKTDNDSTSIQLTPLIKRKKKSNKWFVKRKHFVIFFSVLSIFFLYYQITSFIMLSWNASNDAESSYLSKNNKISKEEIEFLKDQISVYIPGVLPENSKNYIKTSNEFKCLQSGETILFNQINDHNCDCEDGTDEPSTSACKNNIFNCLQTAFTGKKFIPSNQVNDGICDCCEGSDEWLNKTNPLSYANINLELIRSKSNNFITPCKNQCLKNN